MDPTVRTMVLTAALVFVGFFAAMTVSVLIEEGFDILTAAAIFILVLIVPPLISAIRNPPQ
jgi:hypothetical protein